MMIPFLAMLVAIGLPLCWLGSEFGQSRTLRILLGITAIVSSVGVTYTAASIGFTFNYNAWYGSATSDLIHAVVEATEAGRSEKVLKVLRQLDRDFNPTYENRANYRDLAEAATEAIRSPQDVQPGTRWDSSPFSKDTWIGHWENDSGYWIVVRHSAGWKVVPSGGPIVGEPATVSADFRQLAFSKPDEWNHTITLVSKHEALHEWRNAKTGAIWKTEKLHKLIPARPEQKNVTEAETLPTQHTSDGDQSAPSK
jgi:hypothetical protein